MWEISVGVSPWNLFQKIPSGVVLGFVTKSSVGPGLSSKIFGGFLQELCQGILLAISVRGLPAYS